MKTKLRKAYQFHTARAGVPMTRAEAVALVGEAAVDAVERQNCEHTCTSRNDGGVEFSAHLALGDGDGEIVLYYVIPRDEWDAAPEDCDLDWFDWSAMVDRYEIQ